MPQQSFQAIIKDRAKLFRDLKIDDVFEPFIGTSYAVEGQKRILFVSYDEWSYMDEIKSYHTLRGRATKEFKQKSKYAEFMNIRQLFRSSTYYKHINDVLSKLDLGLSAEDVSFHNFMVKPISFPSVNTETNRSAINAEDDSRSIRAFKAVIQFLNPDLVIFCSLTDKNRIDQAFNRQLESFLQGIGIVWLDDANLDYDIIPSDKDIMSNWAIKTITPKQAYMSFNYPSRYCGEDDDPCTHTGILLNLQMTPLEDDEIVKGIPESLQRFAAFVKDEVSLQGSFMLHRYHYLVREMHERMKFNYTELEDNVIEDDREPEYYWHDPLCNFVRPYTYDSYLMLKSFDSLLKANLKRPECKKPKFCGKYTSERMQKASIERTAQKNKKNKLELQKINMQFVADEKPSEEKNRRAVFRAHKRQKYYETLRCEEERRKANEPNELEEMNMLVSIMKPHTQEDIDRISSSRASEEVIWKKIAESVGLTVNQLDRFCELQNKYDPRIQIDNLFEKSLGK